MQKDDMKELEAFADVTETLPGTLAAASPHRLPAHLRARVLRAAEVRGGRTSRRLGFRAAVRALAAAVLVLSVVGLVLWNVQLQQALAQDRTLLGQLRDAAGKQPLVFDIVDSAQSQKALLRAAGPRRPGEDPPYGKLYTNPSFSQIVVMTGRLPAAPVGSEYVLTLVSASGAVAALPPLAVDATGFAYLVYDTGGRGPTFTSARLELRSTDPASRDSVLILAWDAR
jgi:hypothetical protein